MKKILFGLIIIGLWIGLTGCEIKQDYEENDTTIHERLITLTVNSPILESFCIPKSFSEFTEYNTNETYVINYKYLPNHPDYEYITIIYHGSKYEFNIYNQTIVNITFN